MAAQTRVYIVQPRTEGDQPIPTNQRRLVRATHPAHALRHVADGAYLVQVASQDDLIELLDAGVRPEDIRQEQQQLPTD